MALRPGSPGPEFAAAWDGLPVSDLFERIRQSMPPSNPGSVTPAAKVDIIAHLLKGNRIPAGHDRAAQGSRRPEADPVQGHQALTAVRS